MLMMMVAIYMRRYRAATRLVCSITSTCPKQCFRIAMGAEADVIVAAYKVLTSHCFLRTSLHLGSRGICGSSRIGDPQVTELRHAQTNIPKPLSGSQVAR
jgi:hypothetical protein